MKIQFKTKEELLNCPYTRLVVEDWATIIRWKNGAAIFDYMAGNVYSCILEEYESFFIARNVQYQRGHGDGIFHIDKKSFVVLEE